MNTILNTNRIISSGQIHDCLGIMFQSANLLRAMPGWEPGDTPRTDALEGEGRVALERTLVHACERLSEILNDESRWKLPEADAQQLLLVNLSQSVAVQQETLKQLRLQTAAMEKGISIRFEHETRPPEDGNLQAQ